MKKLYTFIAGTLLFGTVNATIVNVSVTSNAFTPSSVTINVGDTVRWTNNQGTHNVNGTTQTFPSNPESFGNAVGSGWTYEFQFTIAGNYGYQCDPHAGFGMTGQVTVQQTTGFNDLAKKTLSIDLYPNPATDNINIQVSGLSSAQVDLISPDGKLIRSLNVRSGTTAIGIVDLPRGIYFARLREGDRVVTKRFLVQ